jgi:purine-cytosine permease-like protein
MDVVEERQKFLNKKYSRLIWSYYREFFGLPKIILTVALVFGLHTIIQLFNNSNVFPIIIVSFILIAGFFAFRKRYYFKQKAKETGMKWLFEEIMLNRVIFLLFFLPSTIINLSILFTNNFEPSEWSLIIGETAFVLVGLLIYIQLMIVPKRVAEDLAKAYPEYFTQKA